MLRPGSIALAFALSAALGGTCSAQSIQAQLKAGNLAASLSAQERASGTNAKLDNALLSVKLQAQATASATQTRSLAENYVMVDIIAQGDVAALRAQLEQLGFRTEAVYRNDIGGSLPVSRIDQAAALPGVITMNLPQSRTHSGRVNSQGDSAQRSKALREAVQLRLPSANEPNPPHLDGSGLTIGVLSDSFNCKGDKDRDIASDDLPAGVAIVKEGACGSGPRDEGRAMAQIIHDVAPGARIAFYSPDSMADFAQGIRTLAMPADQIDENHRHGAGAQIVVDDLGFLNEPLYQEGIIGEAIDEVATEHGTLYFSSAGNFANQGKAAYGNDAPVFAAAPVVRRRVDRDDPLNLGERLLNFDASGATTLENLPVTIPGTRRGEQAEITIAVYWDQPMSPPNASSSLELCLGDRNGKKIAEGLCSGPSVIGQPAQTILSLNYSGGGYNGTLRLGLAGGPAPGRVHVVVFDERSIINRFGTDKGTIIGHPLSPHAQAVGAADYFKTPYCNAALRTATRESFSSHGGTPLLFDNEGAALANAVTPAKPDIVAPDGVITTFFSDASWNADAANAAVADCRSQALYPHHFYGTSAAAPHAAAVAALLMQADQLQAAQLQADRQIDRHDEMDATAVAPLLPVAQRVYEAMQASALDMDDARFDYSSGHGFIQADQALAALRARRLPTGPALPRVVPVKPGIGKVATDAHP